MTLAFIKAYCGQLVAVRGKLEGSTLGSVNPELNFREQTYSSCKREGLDFPGALSLQITPTCVDIH